MLQKDLDTAPHSAEELVEKSQILNPVLIQQMSQAWKVPTTGRRSELSATVIYYQYIDNVQLSLLLVCTFLQSGCEMFAQQLFLHSGNERFSRGLQSHGYKSVFIYVTIQTHRQIDSKTDKTYSQIDN